MARIDLSRRAEIGRERRERTRSALLGAAKRVFSESPIENVTIDDVVRSAGVAKGTFYYHFRDFDALIAAIGEELATEFDALLQPERSLLADPLERFALGQISFLRRAEEEPRWGRLVRHARFTQDGAAASVREHLAADLEDARRAGSLTLFETPFALRLVLAMAMEFLGDLEAPPTLRPRAGAMVESILRALGVPEREAASILTRVRARSGPKEKST
jgi:AcrR family transcriptional regulator